MPEATKILLSQKSSPADSKKALPSSKLPLIANKSNEKKPENWLSHGDILSLFAIILIFFGFYFFVFPFFQNLNLTDNNDYLKDSDNLEDDSDNSGISYTVLSKEFLSENCQAKFKKDCEILEFNNDGISDCFFVYTEFMSRGICIPVNCHSQTLQTEDVCGRYDYCEWISKQGICREISSVNISDIV